MSDDFFWKPSENLSQNGSCAQGEREGANCRGVRRGKSDNPRRAPDSHAPRFPHFPLLHPPKPGTTASQRRFFSHLHGIQIVGLAAIWCKVFGCYLLVPWQCYLVTTLETVFFRLRWRVRNQKAFLFVQNGELCCWQCTSSPVQDALLYMLRSSQLPVSFQSKICSCLNTHMQSWFWQVGIANEVGSCVTCLMMVWPGVVEIWPFQRWSCTLANQENNWRPVVWPGLRETTNLQVSRKYIWHEALESLGVTNILKVLNSFEIGAVSQADSALKGVCKQWGRSKSGLQCCVHVPMRSQNAVSIKMFCILHSTWLAPHLKSFLRSDTEVKDSMVNYTPVLQPDQSLAWSEHMKTENALGTKYQACILMRCTPATCISEWAELVGLECTSAVYSGPIARSFFLSFAIPCVLFLKMSCWNNDKIHFYGLYYCSNKIVINFFLMVFCHIILSTRTRSRCTKLLFGERTVWSTKQEELCGLVQPNYLSARMAASTGTPGSGWEQLHLRFSSFRITKMFAEQNVSGHINYSGGGGGPRSLWIHWRRKRPCREHISVIVYPWQELDCKSAPRFIRAVIFRGIFQLPLASEASVKFGDAKVHFIAQEEPISSFLQSCKMVHVTNLRWLFLRFVLCSIL